MLIRLAAFYAMPAACLNLTEAREIRAVILAGGKGRRLAALFLYRRGCAADAADCRHSYSERHPTGCCSWSTPRELLQHAVESFDAGNVLGAVVNASIIREAVTRTRMSITKQLHDQSMAVSDCIFFSLSVLLTASGEASMRFMGENLGLVIVLLSSQICLHLNGVGELLVDSRLQIFLQKILKSVGASSFWPLLCST